MLFVLSLSLTLRRLSVMMVFFFLIFLKSCASELALCLGKLFLLCFLLSLSLFARSALFYRLCRWKISPNPKLLSYRLHFGPFKGFRIFPFLGILGTISVFLILSLITITTFFLEASGDLFLFWFLWPLNEKSFAAAPDLSKAFDKVFTKLWFVNFSPFESFLLPVTSLVFFPVVLQQLL